MASAWGGAWGAAFGSAFGALFVETRQSVPESLGQGGGPGGDRHAYDPDRVRDRLRAILINGKEYNPFDVHIIDALESAAREPIEADDELTRQNAKLDRTFTVKTDKGDVVVPMFRPILDQLPDLKTALAKDILAYAERAREEIEDERRRIVLLLLDS